mmetsp:Transcript_50551/g.133468  ORF Transcript_50551/g.133468 Transcript_50551/m.133468 type:complete len:245 (-) Transcript_50551:55-789(-)
MRASFLLCALAPGLAAAAAPASHAAQASKAALRPSTPMGLADEVERHDPDPPKKSSADPPKSAEVTSMPETKVTKMEEMEYEVLEEQIVAKDLALLEKIDQMREELEAAKKNKVVGKTKLKTAEQELEKAEEEMVHVHEEIDRIKKEAHLHEKGWGKKRLIECGMEIEQTEVHIEEVEHVLEVAEVTTTRGMTAPFGDHSRPAHPGTWLPGAKEETKEAKSGAATRGLTSAAVATVALALALRW